METEINVEELMHELSENKVASKNCSNDGNIREIESKVDDGKVSCVFKMSSLFDTSENSIDSTENCTSDSFKNPNSTATFKKPTVLIGPKRSRSACKILKPSTTSTDENTVHCSDHVTTSQEHSKDPPFPYVEPPWSGKPERSYKMEVLKSGVIVETISLSEQNFYIVGRVPSCHVSLAHPTISRYHAVLQYRSKEDEGNSKGFYVYDLGSTHGTFWNGNLIKPNVYVRVRGGHMLRFGCSQRKYILQAPLDDQDEESQYTVSELKEMRASELEKRRTSTVAEAAMEEKESGGIDWGMGEDADEETDLQENPYACIADENLVLEDPKKTLRGWFEREGYDLQYKTEEKGPGQFLCWVDLPMEDIVGRSMRAEALVKGKKKEAVVQCALEACKVLDKYGLLRQANHEARKRKTRNWEAEDYYDSDEDNFLDRTGSIERKREQRMRLAGKLENKVETYDSLLEKHAKVTKRISHLSNSIKNWQSENNANKETTEEDALDAFMSSLSSSALTKSDIAKMKLELQNLRKEEADLIKLLNLTRPANLPTLICHNVTTDQTVHQIKVKTNLVQGTSTKVSKTQRSVFCRRKKKDAKHQADVNSNPFVSSTVTDGEIEAEFEEDSDTENSESCLSSTTSITAAAAATTTTTTMITTTTTTTTTTTITTTTTTTTTTAATATATTTTTTPTTTIIVTTTSNTAATAPITTTNNSLGENENQQKHNIGIIKKRRQERQKIPSDQDIYADNYSMWVPPQDQVGDGKTSLNEKYGY